MQDTHRTAERVIDIIEFLAQNENGATFSELSRALCMPKSSLHPLIHTLDKRRYVHYKANEQRYYLGDCIFSLGMGYISSSNLLQSIDAVLEALALRVNETCFLGVLGGTEILYLLKQSPPSPIYVAARSGSRMKAYCTAIGKALISQLDMQTLRAMYPDPLPAITGNTVTSIDALWQQLEEIRATGFGYEREESSSHIQCISTPIQYRGNIIAAISAAFPVFSDKSDPEKLQAIKDCLLDARRDIEAIIAANWKDWIYGD